jgi:hypothetical protein
MPADSTQRAFMLIDMATTSCTRKALQVDRKLDTALRNAVQVIGQVQDTCACEQAMTCPLQAHGTGARNGAQPWTSSAIQIDA